MKRTLLIIGLLALAVMASAQARRYLVFGRDPMIPGGLSQAMVQNRGWESAVLMEDTWLTMWGAKGEQVTGWAPKGLKGAWDQYGRFVIGVCGNYTDLRRQPKPPPKIETPPKVTIYPDRWPKETVPPPDVNVTASALASTGSMTFNFFQPAAATSSPLLDWRGQTTVTENSLIGWFWQPRSRPTSIKINNVNNNANTNVNANNQVQNLVNGNGASGSAAGSAGGAGNSGAGNSGGRSP